MFLNDEKFAKLVAISPLISIDICILKDSDLLLGKRKNSPAKNFYFVPGGRIRKNEKIDYAIDRLLAEELGLILKSNEKKFLGIFEHFYEENFLENSNFGTHYIVLAFLIKHEDVQKITEVVNFIDQHSEYIWYNLNNKNNKDLKVHKYSLDYVKLITDNI